MRRRYQRPRAPALLVLLLLALLLAARWLGRHPEPAAPADMAEGTYRLRRVIDGDTLLLSNNARVRLIGADTPETVKPDHPPQPWGAEATQFTRSFVAAGTVRLTFDRERLDRYGRFLAYVWVGERMLNEELIRAGLATAQVRFRYSETMKRRFLRAEREAQAARRGIWSDERRSPSAAEGRPKAA